MTTVTLTRPVVFESQTYASVEVDEPTVGGIEAYEKAHATGATETGAMIALLAAETGWPEGAVRKIRAGDLRRISEAMAPFVNVEGGATGA